jgi:CTP:molybdopterin cytidylyltransferase MocA
MRKCYVVNLTDDERTTVCDLVRKGAVTARTLTRAHILLQADQDVADQAIADAPHVDRATVERIANASAKATVNWRFTTATAREKLKLFIHRNHCGQPLANLNTYAEELSTLMTENFHLFDNT